MTTTTIGMRTMNNQTGPTPEEWARMLTVKQVAEIMHVNVWGVYKAVQRGRIPAYRIHPGGRDYYLLPEDVRQFYPGFPRDVG